MLLGYAYGKIYPIVQQIHLYDFFLYYLVSLLIITWEYTVRARSQVHCWEYISIAIQDMED